MSIPLNDDRADGTASDADDSDGPPAYEADYRPISTAAESDEDDDGGGGGGYSLTAHSNGGDLVRDIPPNPSFFYQNGVSRLDLNGDGIRVGEEGEEDEEGAEDEEREREASISRAFIEDESRRNAPLTRETTARIMEAMRGVSFPGCPPDWVERVPEDRWVDQLTRLRGGESTPTQQS